MRSKSWINNDRAIELRAQELQRLRVIDVVPLGQDVHGEPNLRGTRLRLLGNVFGAPGDVFKQASIRPIDGATDAVKKAADSGGPNAT